MKRRLITQTEVAERLSVSRGQVHMWDKRRRVNGFPGPVSMMAHGSRMRPLYDWAAVKAWHRTYVPGAGRGQGKAV